MNTPTSASGPVRLNKAIAMSGLCSRRKAEEHIRNGRVTVNDRTVEELGTMVDPAKDRIAVGGILLRFSFKNGREEHVYLVLNKPVRTVTTARDPQGRTTVLDLLPASVRHKRIFPVGRLDFFSEGVLLLTSDGALTQRMTHPRYEHPKVYEVLVRGHVSREALATMREGMTLAEGERLAPVQVRILKAPGNDRTLLELTLRQGINRQIRRMCRDLGLTIISLKRVAQGPVRLKGLRPGRVRSLTPEEIRELRSSVGLR
jgi:23S rRNA pseudouridine2605 synthase